MIAEDKEVLITTKSEKKAGEQTEEQPATPLLTEAQSNEKSIIEQKPQLEPCRSSWIKHLMMTDQQMYSSVRDYIVTSNRIGSLL